MKLQVKNQSVLNILVGKFNNDNYEHPQIIYSNIIKDRKSETIQPIVESVILPLIRYNFNKNNFKVLITDGTSYFRKLGRKLKQNYGCLHLICGCHNLHNYSEYLRKKHTKLDYLISFLKRILIKNKSNKNLWKKVTEIALPKLPMLTRWRIWVCCGIFLSTHKYKVFDFLNEIRDLYEHEVRTVNTCVKLKKTRRYFIIF